MFTNKFKRIVNKVLSVSNRFQDLFSFEKEGSKSLHKPKHENKVNLSDEEKCINAKNATFQKKIKAFSQISDLKSKINQIWSSLKGNSLITTDLDKFINELKTDFGFTQDDFNNMTINNDIVYWLSLINNVENNDSQENLKKIATKNHLKKHDILPWDTRLKKVELPNFSLPNDSIETLQDILQKLEQFQNKITKCENEQRLLEAFNKFMLNELKVNPGLKIYVSKEDKKLTYTVLCVLRFLQDKKVIKVTAEKSGQKRLVPTKLNSKRLYKDILKVNFIDKRLSEKIRQKAINLFLGQPLSHDNEKPNIESIDFDTAIINLKLKNDEEPVKSVISHSTIPNANNSNISSRSN